MLLPQSASFGHNFGFFRMFIILIIFLAVCYTYTSRLIYLSVPDSLLRVTTNCSTSSQPSAQQSAQRHSHYFKSYLQRFFPTPPSPHPPSIVGLSAISPTSPFHSMATSPNNDTDTSLLSPILLTDLSSTSDFWLSAPTQRLPIVNKTPPRQHNHHPHYFSSSDDDDTTLWANIPSIISCEHPPSVSPINSPFSTMSGGCNDAYRMSHEDVSSPPSKSQPTKQLAPKARLGQLIVAPPPH